MTQEGYLSDKVYDEAASLVQKVLELDPRNEEHFLNVKDYPHLIYSWAYNDGLNDALDRIIRFEKSGQYSDKTHVLNMLHDYDHLIENANQKGLFWDEIYLEGYWTGLSVLVTSEHDSSKSGEQNLFKQYLLFQYDSEKPINDLSTLRKYLETTKEVDEEYYQYALKKVQDLPDNFIIRHSGELPPAVFDFTMQGRESQNFSPPGAEASI